MGVCWPVLKEGDSLGVIDTKVQIIVRMVKFTTFIMNYFLKGKLIYIQQCVLGSGMVTNAILFCSLFWRAKKII